MNFEQWNATAITNIFSNNNNTKATIPTNVSSYFRRPAKIIKPKAGSRNNSPRSHGQRRMTTTGHFPTRTRSVIEHQRTTIPQHTEYQTQTSRPISWHPNTMEEPGQFQYPFYSMNNNMITTPYVTSEVNGLVTPLSYPVMHEPQIQELIAPLEDLSANETSTYYGDQQDFSMTNYWLSQEQLKTATPDYENGGLFPDMNYQSWYNNHQYQIQNVPTAPPSPNYLPMPEFGTPLVVPEPEIKPEKDELVGMGLYDSPADVRTSSLLFGRDLGPMKRKSLKLEDAFEPLPASDESEDAEAEDDDEYSHDPVTIDLTDSPDTDALPSAEYSYLMNNEYHNNNVMMHQWPMETQQIYGWI